MYPFSFDLNNGSRFFADAAISEIDNKKRRYYNAASVIFAAATIEAVLNEQIALRSQFGSDVHIPVPNDLFDALCNSQKSISLKDRWNLFVSVRGGHPWNSSKEPFQIYEMIIALRNALLHYRAKFLGHCEVPISRLKILMDRFGPKAMPKTEDELTTWIIALLESPKLSHWIWDNIKYDQLLDSLLGVKQHNTDR